MLIIPCDIDICTRVLITSGMIIDPVWLVKQDLFFLFGFFISMTLAINTV